jgi:hypothetical protein
LKTALQASSSNSQILEEDAITESLGQTEKTINTSNEQEWSIKVPEKVD